MMVGVIVLGLFILAAIWVFARRYRAKPTHLRHSPVLTRTSLDLL